MDKTENRDSRRDVEFLCCLVVLYAGAREMIYHDPLHTQVAIVTCGGLCPGLNDVVAVRGPGGGEGVGGGSMTASSGSRGGRVCTGEAAAGAG